MDPRLKLKAKKLHVRLTRTNEFGKRVPKTTTALKKDIQKVLKKRIKFGTKAPTGNRRVSGQRKIPKRKKSLTQTSNSRPVIALCDICGEAGGKKRCKTCKYYTCQDCHAEWSEAWRGMFSQEGYVTCPTCREPYLTPEQGKRPLTKLKSMSVSP